MKKTMKKYVICYKNVKIRLHQTISRYIMTPQVSSITYVVLWEKTYLLRRKT